MGRRLRWDTALTGEWDHPLLVPAMGILMAALFAIRPLMDWHGGAWRPLPQEALYPLAGLALGAVCVVPDLLWYRRRGDEYIKRVSRPGWLVRSLSFPLWYLITVMLPRFLVSTAAMSRYDALMFSAGASIGLIAWYPLMRAIWKHKHQLREAADEGIRELNGIARHEST